MNLIRAVSGGSGHTISVDSRPGIVAQPATITTTPAKTFLKEG
jgi:hypothetical protein